MFSNMYRGSVCLRAMVMECIEESGVGEGCHYGFNATELEVGEVTVQ